MSAYMDRGCSVLGGGHTEQPGREATVHLTLDMTSISSGVMRAGGCGDMFGSPDFIS